MSGPALRTILYGDSAMAVVAVPLEAVQPEWDPLFAAGPGVQSTRMWFEATIEAALPAGARAEFLLCRDAGRPVAMLPLLVGPGGAARGLSTVYTSLFQPLLAPGLLEADVRRAGFALARHCRRWRARRGCAPTSRDSSPNCRARSTKPGIF